MRTNSESTIMREEKGLYDAIKSVMSKRPKEQFTAQALWANSNVSKYAASAVRVSDYLGNMWRKGLLHRLPAPGGDDSKSRYCYVWKGAKAVSSKVDLTKAIEFKGRGILVVRPEITIAEDGNDLFIETTGLSIVIKRK